MTEKEIRKINICTDESPWSTRLYHGLEQFGTGIRCPTILGFFDRLYPFPLGMNGSVVIVY